MSKINLELELLQDFPHVTVQDLNEILQWLEERKHLNKEGEKLRHNFQELYIKK